MFRSAMILISGNAFASLLLLARNLIVARLISVEDYGIAATFAVAMAVVEMMSALGLQHQIVQSKDGDDPHFQAALQGFQVLRGVISGAALFLIADPLARFLGIAEVAWAYQLLALVQVLNALRHFDIYRVNRQMVFGPMLMTGVTPAFLSVLAVWPLSILYGNYTVMLYAILIQAAVGTATSHLVAERPYRLAFDRKIMSNSLRFGWPIFVDGILLFLVFQGDKLIVGRELGMEVLAIFAMGMTLTLTPTLVFGGSLVSFFLPQLTAAEEQFDRLSIIIFEATLLFSAALVLGTLLFAPIFVQMVLGAKFADLVPLLTWLAILQGVRNLKFGPAVVALAKAQTENTMIANILRVAVLPIAWWLVSWTGDIMHVIAIAILGEVLGAITAFALVRWRVGLDMRALRVPALLTVLTMGMAGITTFGLADAHNLSLPLWLGMCATGLLFIVSFLTMRDLRGYIARRSRKVNK